MTAPSSQKLADALRAAGVEELAKRAELDEFHDFLSPHDLPSITLNIELVAILKSEIPQEMALAITNIRAQHLDGEFDATTEESDAWANSPEGQATFAKLLEGR
jgi:hypothetical protein